MVPKTQITSLTIRGFKSIRCLEDFRPGRLNVLIGANGSGKSNFIDFFRLLERMMSRNLQYEISLRGGASKLLFHGPSVTQEIEAEICISTSGGTNGYKFRLNRTQMDTFVFAEEWRRFQSDRTHEQYPRKDLGSRGFLESRFPEAAEGGNGDQISMFIYELLRGVRVYQFHDTSKNSPLKQKSAITDCALLREDGGNLASFLYSLSASNPRVYWTIVQHCRSVLPFFDDFVFQPENGYLFLNWRELDSPTVFAASSASDGMLRAICLITLLSLPEGRFPRVLFLDEPELGLHPSALDLVAGMIEVASRHTQVFVATQSPTMVNCFDPEMIRVIERKGRESIFLPPLNPEELQGWLEEYTLGDLWLKNVLGGRP